MCRIKRPYEQRKKGDKSLLIVVNQTVKLHISSRRAKSYSPDFTENSRDFGRNENYFVTLW